MIHIVIDSVAYLSREYVEEHNLTVVPLSYIFEGESTKEPLPGEFDAFYERLQKSKEFPTTSQPSVGNFYLVFDELTKNPEDEVICITLSSGISGTYNSALLAKKESAEDRIYVIDSTFAAAMEARLIEIAVQLRDEGKPAKEIVEAIYDEIPQLSMNLLVDNLEYLKRGGRISGSVAAVGGFLGIKPIITFVEGKLEMKDKVRGMKKAIEKSIADIPKDATWVRVHHILAKDLAEEIAQEIRTQFPEADVALWELGPVIGCHVGPGTVGIAYNGVK